MGCIIETNVGLGDLFILRLLLDNNDNNKDITCDISISKTIIEKYRTTDKQYLYFLFYLTRQLFPDRKVFYVNKNYHDEKFNIIAANSLFQLFDTNKTIITKDLKKYFPIPRNIEITTKYIVFQTKVRIDGKGIEYHNLIKFSKLMEKFKTNYKIFIIGEKKISCTKEKDLHKITSIYDYLLPLKKNNDVIDLVEDEIVIKPNVNIFERDMALIRDAEMNIGFGWGGNFSMTWSMSDHFCFFIDNLIHPLFPFFEKINKGFLYRDFDNFLEKIKIFV